MLKLLNRGKRIKPALPDSELLSEWDKKSVWHPFTQMSEWVQEKPLIIESGKGCYLYDTRGERYIDGVSSLWCNVHGHRVPELDRAVRKQLNRIAHSTFLGLSNVPAVLLAKKITGLLPDGLTRIFYSDSGSASVEIALKIAYQYWQNKGEKKKTKFIHLANAYHGDTLGAVSVGGIELFHSIYKPLLFDTIPAPAPDRYHDKFKGNDPEYLGHCVRKIERIIETHKNEACALVMEPLIQGAAGMLVHPKGFLAAIRALTQKHKILLILDEVATGFGRTGRMFACEHESVRPDLLCLAKGLTGGYLPLAVTAATEEIYNAFLGRYETLKTFFHGHTYAANPLACAAALANLELFEKKRTLEHLQPKIKYLQTALQKFYALPHVGNIRQSGFMAGIELVKDKTQKLPYGLADRIGHRVTCRARELGAVIRPLGPVIVLMPPLVISLPVLKRLLHIVYQSIREITETQNG